MISRLPFGSFIFEYFSGNEGYCNYYILSQEGEYMKWDR